MVGHLTRFLIDLLGCVWSKMWKNRTWRTSHWDKWLYPIVSEPYQLSTSVRNKSETRAWSTSWQCNHYYPYNPKARDHGTSKVVSRHKAHTKRYETHHRGKMLAWTSPQTSPCNYKPNSKECRLNSHAKEWEKELKHHSIPVCIWYSSVYSRKWGCVLNALCLAFL